MSVTGEQWLVIPGDYQNYPGSLLNTQITRPQPRSKVSESFMAFVPESVGLKKIPAGDFDIRRAVEMPV